jgi:hypothetical protein
MKDYLKIYSNKANKFQEGGPMPGPAGMPEGGAPAPGGDGGGGGIEQALMQVVETQDPQLALQVCNMIAEAMGLSGGVPAGGAPMGDPMGAPGGAPMGRYGMKIPIMKRENFIKK